MPSPAPNGDDDADDDDPDFVCKHLWVLQVKLLYVHQPTKSLRRKKKNPIYGYVLGLSKELYYVTEGVPNTYALNFVVPVPATVNALHFTWKTLGQKPLPYSASVDISDPITLEKPVLDIPWNGTIPTETETFTVFMLCTGKRSDEVFVELTINVTADPKFRVNEVTTIVLKRKKVCLEGNAGKADL
ncbi:Tyrosine-protein kinase Drl [Orchesella cincta]|uniref:Tyrosine-protein kinase Drl n=1 Tax=Orchesella cincta TaxID=48709 RepID=A0A1D2NCF2_ORCCI|nr:Tyrosine-protein kinase Drl [Orchesella cincta]